VTKLPSVRLYFHNIPYIWVDHMCS